MAKLSPSRYEAEDYLLGRLTSAERRQFEARLEQLPELHAQVRELEEGLVVLALSAPPHTAPRAAWQNIEAAIARPARWNLWLPFTGLKWFANGWGVAAALAAVLMGHLLWPRPATSTTTLARNAPATNSVSGGWPQNSATVAGARAATNTPAAVENEKKRPALAQIADPRVNFLQVRPSGSKEFSPPNLRTAAFKTNLSPSVRQTMLLAAARQMGLDRRTSAAEADDRQQQVDFVDLTTPAEVAPSGVNAGPMLASSEIPQDNNPNPNGAAVPMMSSPPYILALVDPGTLSPDMNPITIWRTGDDGSPAVFGVVPLGANPTVIALPGLAATPGRSIFFITAGTSNYIIGQFPPP